jgi:hypothetical protein
MSDTLGELRRPRALFFFMSHISTTFKVILNIHTHIRTPLGEQTVDSDDMIDNQSANNPYLHIASMHTVKFQRLLGMSVGFACLLPHLIFSQGLKKHSQ